MASARPLRIGIVGCGGISERHAHGAAATDAVSIVACCDVRPDIAQEWSRRHGCERAYADYLTMVREHELDAVLIATWPNLHRDQVLGCLEAGARSILCEKSLALTGVEAIEIWTAAGEAGALVVEGFMYRHHPAIAGIDELLAAGSVGQLDNIWAAFSLFDPAEPEADDPNRDWRQRKEYGGGAPWDLASYCVDACNRFAASPPRRAMSVAQTNDRYGTIDRLYGLVEYENGVVGMVESSKRSDFNHELRISGSRGEVRLPVAWRIEGKTEVVASRSLGWGKFESERHPIPEADAFRLQLEAFATAVREDAPPRPALADSVVNALTLDALLASAAAHEVVDVRVPAGVVT
jgi:xylose dehydrogenase (NAD/NADP)